MKKRALGKGLEALKPKQEVTSNNKEVETENLEVATSAAKFRSKNVKHITCNREVLREVMSENSRISLWSPKSAAVLRYLRKTKPQFSISDEAKLLLEDAISRKYPELTMQTERMLDKRRRSKVRSWWQFWK